MNIQKIKCVSDRLYPKLNCFTSPEFAMLAQAKKHIQETATKDFSEGDLISIARSEISEPVFSKLTKAGRELYNKTPTEDILFIVSYAIAAIIDDYEWDFDHYSNSHLSYISQRVEDSFYDLDILLRSHLEVIDAYCASSRNWVSLNLPREQGFKNDVNNWYRSYHSLSKEEIYEKIETAARNVVVNQYNWDEFDVDGFSWAIGSFTFICVSAGLLSSFDDGFKNVYRSYINKGFEKIKINKAENTATKHKSLFSLLFGK